MSNLPPLVSDLALVMGAAAVVTLVFKWLKQPMVLGYILAGVLVGPKFPLFPSVADAESIEVWAQIGVIVLLFCLGLEFSFKKLMRVGGTASVIAITELLVMMFLGIGAGRALGWSNTDSIFLGAMVSISSTTIIIRAFEELGVKEKKFANVVFGILVVQDLAAILMLVLLPTIGASTMLSGAELLKPVGKLVFFLVLWFVSGIFFLPTIFRKASKFMNNEMLLISALALCFLMVVLATQAGFSPALGAFIMGSILAETPFGGKIEHHTTAIKEMFGAVFFVSVGMMIDLAAVPQYWTQILGITLLVLVGQPLSTMLGALLSRQPLKISVQTAMSLSQIGEFSFIIATTGLSLALTSPQLYPIAVLVSAVTTFTTPYMIKASGGVFRFLDRRLPGAWKAAIDKYSSEGQAVKPTSDWTRYITNYVIQMFVYSVIVIGCVLVVSKVVLPAVVYKSDTPLMRALVGGVALLVMSPFLWSLSIRRISPGIATRLWTNKYYRGPMVVLQLLRFVITLVLMGFLVHYIVSYVVALCLLAVTIALLVINYKRLQMVSTWVEGRFISNLNEKEQQDKRDSGAHLTPWDAHITNFTVSPDFKGAGLMLMELHLREDYGVNIAMIKRGDFTIQAPARTERVYPDDTLFVIGTDEQVTAFKHYLDENSPTRVKKIMPEDELTLQRVEIGYGAEVVGKTIKESEIRELTKGLIVGIERSGERLLNPESSVTLQSGDVLWIVGNPKRILVFEKTMAKGHNPESGTVLVAG